MGCIITALYTFSLINVIVTWVEFRRAYVFAISVQARYDLWFSSLSLEIMATATSALNLIIADCTIVRVDYPYWDYYSYWLPFRSGVVGLCGLTIGE